MADRDKRAIPVRLGINSGRQSPNTEPPKGVLVYADAKVNWFFVEGAFVLQSIHKRDHAQLEKDFDLYLKRPGSRGEICLNPERDITEYGIKKDDELEFRHKTLPISVSIDLYQGETRTVEVNSGYPVMDVVQAICGTVAIDRGLELSLALAKKNKDSSATQYQWLDSQSSLNGQGVKDGDTLLLRKKFFILNDDVEEAINGNSLLRDLLYHQIREMFLDDGFVGLTGVDKDKALAKVSCYLHHTEQKDESISDDLIASKVIPKCRQQDESFPSKLITVYFQERMVGLSEEETKVKMLGLFLAPQSIAATYYPVKIEEIPDDYVLVCHSNGITQCSIEDGRLQPVDDREWRYINIRGANSTHKQKIVSVNALGSRHELITSYSVQIASHITESLRLTKLKTEHKKQTPLPPTPVPAADTPTPTVPAPAVIAPLPAEYEYPAPDPPSPPPQAVIEPPPAQQEVETPLAQQVEPPPPQKEVDPPVQQQEVDPSEGVDPLAQQQEVGEEQAGVHLPLDPTEDQGPVEEPPVRPPTPEPCSPEPPQTTMTLVGRKRTSCRPQEAPSEPTAPPSNSLPTIQVTPLPIPNIQIEEEVEENRGSSSLEHKPEPGEEEKEKIPLTPVTALGFSPTLYIPEYFGLDFRDVLRDYRLFHVVVMDRDKRSLLLNIKKPAREVVKVTCATFNIQDQQRQRFWLPKGKKNILQKYGGKPKKRVGKFLRKTASLPIAPKQELEADKSLEEQYDFDIKPYVIHLQ